MEVGDGGDGWPPPDGIHYQFKKERERKSFFQLEVLKEAYAVDPRPPAEVRAELAERTGLPVEKVSMWFATTRFTDKQRPPASQPRRQGRPPLHPLGNGTVMEAASGSREGSGSSFLGGGIVSGPFPSSVSISRPDKVMPTRLYKPARPIQPLLRSLLPLERPMPPALQPPMTQLKVRPPHLMMPHPQLSVPQLPLPQLTTPQTPLMQHSMPQPSLPQLSMPQSLLLQLTIAQSPLPLLPIPQPLLLQPPQHSTSQQTIHQPPIYAIEFDPLPHGAFGSPIAMTGDFKMFEGQDGKSIKASTFLPNMETSLKPSSSTERSLAVGGINESHPQTSQRVLQQYQFLPEKPSHQSDTNQRVKNSHFFDSSVGTLHTRESSVPLGGQSLYGKEQMASTYTFQGQMSSSILQSQEGGQQIDDGVPQKNSTDIAKDAHCGINPAITPGNQFLSSDWRIFCDNYASRMERIHKGKFIRHEGERIEKEVVTQEKLIVEELEEHNNITKIEEQMRKELDSYYCEQENEAEGPTRQKELQEAARLKAADGNVRYQRIANAYAEFSEDDYTCLIEDERLELMRLAASSKCLSSLSLLDSDTLQRLDLFEDKLGTFPPTLIPLKRPFSVQPWTDSEENIGNLLMVWKFLVTFADVLGLWPFTLDELIQSLHDCDSRLLGEVHVALVKYIIKDIEHVAKSPVCASGTNQISASNPEGVQLQIVEGAHRWGFDILNWQRHLNFLTWPEILRQVALSIGFGPRLNKINVGKPYSSNDDEGHDVGDVISSLRNGAAAENAVALMQEKVPSRIRRSRHRTTPGTVKFAAFHVLSLEGGEGLRLEEIVKKIQKYGLRDLTTNKSPEASIAATLSRDAKLFVRVGPSTYCVRPPFRKDPADADVVLSAARERIQLFKNGLSESTRDEDDAEDFECDTADDPVANTPENVSDSGALNHQTLPSNADHVDAKIDGTDFGEPWVQGLTEGDYSELSVEERLNVLVALIGVAIEGNSLHNILEERLKAAHSLKKQMWAEAKLEKRRLKEEYINKSHISSLIGNSDGNPNSINEEWCFDPAIRDNVNTTSTERNLLGQEFFPYPGTNPPQGHGCIVKMWSSDLKSYIIHKAEEMYAYRYLPLGEDRRHNRYWQFSTSASPDDPGSGRIFFESKDGFWRLIDSEEAFNALLDVLDIHGIRESHLHTMLKKIEKMFKEAIRRKKNCIDSVDSAAHLKGTDTTELTASPECSKTAESLSSTLFGHTLDTMEYSASFRIELGRNELEKRLALNRYQGFMRWMWRTSFNPRILSAMKYGTKRCSALLETCDFCYQSYFAEERHCPCCHVTFKASHNDYVNFPEHLACCEKKRTMDPEWKIQDSDSSVPISIRLLKAQLVLIEVSIPAEALQLFWTEDYRKSWGAKLQSSSSAEELLQISTLLEGAIKQDLLSPDFVTTSELLNSTGGFEVHDIASGSVPVLPWVPNTTAAVAFRLLVLDASIPYMLHQNLSHEEKEDEEFMVLPRYAAGKNIQHLDTTQTLDSVDNQKEGKSFDPGSSSHGVRARGSRGRGGRGRSRGRRHRGYRNPTGAEVEEGTVSENPVRERRRRGRPRGGGRGRGLHLSGPQNRPQSTIPIEGGDVGSSAKQVIDEESPGTCRQAETAHVKETGSGSVVVRASDNSCDDLVTDCATGYNGGKSEVVVIDVDSEAEGADGDGNDVDGDDGEDHGGRVDMDISDDER